MFALTSPAFAPGSATPARYACDGEERSPPLSWVDPPGGARSLALLVDDPDAPDPAAPRRVWVHRIRYTLPATIRELVEGAGNRAPEEGVRECLTAAGSLGYHGPCPPIRRHRYFFHLFALSHPLPDLGKGARRADLERAMTGLVQGTAVLRGTYQRPSARTAQ